MQMGKIKEKTKKVTKKTKQVLLTENGLTKKQKYVILIFTAFVIGLAIYFSVTYVLNSFQKITYVLDEITLDEYIELNNSTDKVGIYIASSDSEVNQNYEEILVEVMKNRTTKMKYLDLTKVNEEGRIITFMNANDFTKDSYTEPMILIFEDGKMKDSLVGSTDKNSLITFLDSNRMD